MNMMTDAAHVAQHEEARAAKVRPREYLSFRLGAEEYGIDILRVQEIRGYADATRIANAPPFIKGVLNLRGTIVPIIDLRMKFNLPDVKYDSQTVTIVLNIGNRIMGVVVDSVSDVIEFKSDQIREAPEFNTTVDATHITGLGTVKTGDEERMLILLNIEQLMESADMGLVVASDALAH